MEDNLISIIVPVYKVEKYLPRCIDSILAQTYTNFELILVDDGSPDNCPQICDEYAKKDKRIKVVHKENGGVSTARNKGLEIAKGKYVCFVDSDDMLDLDYTANLYNEITKNDVDLIITKIEIIYFNKKQRQVNFDKEAIYSINDIKKLYEEKNFYGLFASPCNKIYKRELINSMFPLDIHNGEDAIFNFEYIKNCNKLRVTNAIRYNYYYLNPNSLSKKFRNSTFEDNISAYNRFVEFASSLNLSLGNCNRMLLRGLCSLCRALCKEDKISKKEKMALLKQYINNNQIINATKNYKSYDFKERIAFYIIKKKWTRLFYECCKIM